MSSDMFTLILANTAIPGASPDGYNGSLGAIDMSTVTTFVKPLNMIVVNAQKQMDVVGTIANAIWVTQGSPTTTQPVTNDILSAAKERIGVVMSMHAILTLIAHTDAASRPKIEFRSADIIDSTTAANNHANGGLGALEAAKKIWLYVSTNETALKQFTATAIHVPVLLIANAICRATDGGHNMKSDTLGVSGSIAARACACAGANREEFAAFCTRKDFGHDIWHPLTDISLHEIALALVGKTDKPCIVKAGSVFNGKTYTGGLVSVAVGLNQAAVDRYPPGMLGTSSMINGMDCVIMMMRSLGARIKMQSSGNIIDACNKIKAMLTGDGISREQLLAAKSAIEAMIAYSGGYCKQITEGKDFIASHGAIDALIKRNVVHATAGAELGLWATRETLEKAAVLAMIAQFENVIVPALEMATKALQPAASGAPPGPSAATNLGGVAPTAPVVITTINPVLPPVATPSAAASSAAGASTTVPNPPVVTPAASTSAPGGGTSAIDVAVNSLMALLNMDEATARATLSAAPSGTSTPLTGP